MVIRKILLLLLVITFAFNYTSIAQKEIITTEGKKEFMADEFNIKYDYYLSDGDTVFHGKYTLKKPVIETEESKYFEFLNFSGWYHKGKLDSIWEISSGIVKSVGEGVFSDYKYSFKVSGTEMLARVEFKEDSLIQNWNIFEWSIVESEIQDTLLVLSLKETSNEDELCIHVYKPGEYMDIYVNREGSPLGTWLYNSSLEDGIHIRKWFFEEGQLIKKEIIKSDTAVVIETLQEVEVDIDFEIEKLAMDNEYFRILDIIAMYNSPEGSRYITKERPSVKLLKETKYRLLETDDLFFQLTGKDNYIDGFAKIKRYPYSKEEKSLLDRISKNKQEIEEKIDITIADPQISIAKLSTNEVLRFITLLSHLKEQTLMPINEILRHYDDGALEYIVRDTRILQKFELKEAVEIQIETEDGDELSPYVLEGFSYDKGSLSSLAIIHAYSQFIADKVSQIEDSLDYYISELKREENLVALESELIKKYENNKELCESIITDQINEVAGYDVQKVILGFLDGELSSYSKLENVDKKMEKVEPLIDCMSNIERLLYTIENVPENIQIVEDGYTRTVFNPYTFTNMDEKIKQPIYKAFHQNLLPYIFDQVKGMKCESVRAVDRNITNLFEGMVDLLKKDTKKLERRVRRMSDPQKIADLLEIKIDAN